MRPAALLSPLMARLTTDLCTALIGQGGGFASSRPEVRQGLGALHDGLAKRLRDVAQIALLAGPPSDPLAFLGWGLGPARESLEDLLPAEAPAPLLQQLAGSWRDRRLLLIAWQSGLERQEFDLLFHLLAMAGDKGPFLRKRFWEEKAHGNLPYTTLLFVDDLRDLDHAVPWPVQAALAWLQRDLNLLSRLGNQPPAVHMALRRALLDAVLELATGPGELRDLLACLDLVVEDIDNYNRDEFAYLLLGRLDQPRLAEVCLELCGLLESLTPRAEQRHDATPRQRLDPVHWITRRAAELLIDSGSATPAHYHALVLQKVLLYEEIPSQLRARVAALQVLTSFLANPQRYFAEIEGSHTPEVLATRLWRLLEMLPNLLRAYRFDVACDVVSFAQRFGPTFDLPRKPELLAQVHEAAAEGLANGQPGLQADLMKALPRMGRTGLHLLIDLADHTHRSVRRAALEGLAAAGPSVVPVLFEAMERKPGWHYLRNMLVILGKIGAGGPKVEGLFHQGLEHAEAGVRKEALPGIARLLKENAAGLVAERLTDPDPEVRRRAVACLGLTGVPDPSVYEQLANFLPVNGTDEMALAVIATLNRLRPGPQAGARVEAELIDLVKVGWFGLGMLTTDRPLRLEAIKALGQFPSERARKTLERLLKEKDAAVVRAAQEALLAG